MGTGHSFLHRFFLIGTFCFCATAVILLVNQQTEVVSAEISSFTGVNTQSTVNIQPINGVCSDINGTSALIAPRENLCKSGVPSVVVEKNIYENVGWAWKCAGINNGTNSYCTVLKRMENNSSSISVEPRDENITSTSPIATTTPNVPSAGMVNDTPINPTINQETVTNPSLNTEKTTAGTTGNENIATINTENLQRLKSEAVSKESTSINNDEVVATESQSTMVQEGATKISDSINEITENTITREQSATGDFVQFENVEKSAIVKPSIVVESKDLLRDNNPKITGASNDLLKVEKVELKKQDDAMGNLVLAGKAEPNIIITIYIFSNDPIVISVKVDANGNWNYELDRELSDGQHEAYVAVTDNVGKIISKSEPIAFVKTAQAATMIPLSELTASQSPVQRVSQQYVLIAIIIMCVFLAASLVLIGFLTHKSNLNERID